jgi:hypothetical protein
MTPASNFCFQQPEGILLSRHLKKLLNLKIEKKMVSKAEQQNVAATFVSHYYKLLMTDAQLVVSMFLPKATVDLGKNCDQDVSSALRKLFPTPNHGRVVIKEARVESTEGSRSFAIVVTGTYHRRHNSFAEDFKEVFELQENQHRPKHFGICAAHRIIENQKVEPKQWAQETPPMFAKPAPAEGVPPMPQAEPIAAPPALPPAPPAQPTPAPEPDPSPAASSAPVPASKTKEDEVPKSMAERLRLAKGNKSTGTGSVSAAVPVRVEAKPPTPAASDPIVKKEDTKDPGDDPIRKGKETPNGERRSGGKANNGSERKPREDRQPRDAKEGSRPPRATTAESTVATGESRPRRPRGGDGKVMSKSVVFFDVIVKGLAKDATEATVEALVGCFAPIEKINIISQPDKHDPSVTRTFAFVQFDHSQIEDVPVLVAKVVSACKSNKAFTKDRIQVDAVREKFSTADTTKQTQPQESSTPTTTAVLAQ